MPEKEDKASTVEEKASDEKVADEAKKRIKPVIEEVVPESNENPGEEKESMESKPEDSQTPKPEAETLVKEESKSDIKLFILVAVITALVVAALAGGIYVYLNGISNLSKPTPAPSAAPVIETTPTPTPTASAAAEVKLSTYKVQILNGSGKIGEASKAKALLEKEGFKISNTANAATFDFTDSIIEAKETVGESAITTAEDALSKTYSVKAGDTLPASSTYDIIVTIGSK